MGEICGSGRYLECIYMPLGSSADRRTNWVRLRNLKLPSADVTDEDFDFLVCTENHVPARLDLETNHLEDGSPRGD